MLQELDEFCEKMIEQVDTLSLDNEVVTAVRNTLFGGSNFFVSKELQESKIFDEAWVKTIEALIPSIDAIIRNPKSSIRIEQDIVPVERAKGFSSNSVRHLASHTENVREVHKDGSVTPSKVLVEYREEDFEIYENRFLKTLVNRLYYFLTKRYDAIKDQYESFTRDTLEVNSNFKTLTSTVDCHMTLDVKSFFGNEELNRKNYSLIGRVERLLLLVKGFRATNFISEDLKRAKEVVPPIMKTNIITHNMHFKNCYLLWQYIERYTSLGFDVQTKETPVVMEELYQKKLLDTAMMFYLFHEQNDEAFESSLNLDKAKEKLLKRSRNLKNGDIDFELLPKELPMEYNGVTDEFLKAAKKLFKDPYSGLIEQGTEPSLALRKVIKQMLSIVNAVYKAMFDIPQTDTDIYQQLSNTGLNDEEEVAKYKKQISIMKTVVSVKKQDLIQSEKELARYEKYLAKHLLNIEKNKKKQAALEKKLEQMKLKRELDDLKAKDVTLLSNDKIAQIKNRIKELRLQLMTKEQREKEEEKDAIREQKALLAKQLREDKVARATAKAKYIELSKQDTTNYSTDEIESYKQELLNLKKQSMTKEEWQAYLDKEKEKNRIALDKEKAKKALLLKKQKEKEQARIALLKKKEEEKAALAKQRAEEKAARDKEKQEAKEQARIALLKKKEEEKAALIKQRAEEKAARDKEKQEAKEQARIALLKKKEEEKATREKQKQDEIERLKKLADEEKAKIDCKNKELEEQKERAKKELAEELKAKKELDQLDKEIAEAEIKYGPNSLVVLAKKYIRSANKLYQKAMERKEELKKEDKSLDKVNK